MMTPNRKIKYLSFLLSIVTASLLTACGGAKSAPTTDTTPSTPAPATSHQTPQGGVDGGGGNYIGSDREQIKAIFHGNHGFSLKDTVKEAFKIIEIQVRDRSLDSIEVESIFARMLGPKFSGDSFDIFKDIENSPYELKEEGSCLEDIPRGFKDASTKLDKKESPICFSLEGLKKLPIQAVPFQLVALAIHEHAHHYGFDEADAVKAQQQVLKTMNHSSLIEMQFESLTTAGGVRGEATKLLEKMSTDFSEKLICKHLSALDIKALKLLELAVKVEDRFETRMLVTALNSRLGLTKETFVGADEIKQKTFEMLSFCGEDNLENSHVGYIVKEGDRGQLKEKLLLVRSLANEIILRITDYKSKSAIALRKQSNEGTTK
jgi:hypothetical protein